MRALAQIKVRRQAIACAGALPALLATLCLALSACGSSSKPKQSSLASSATSTQSSQTTQPAKSSNSSNESLEAKIEREQAQARTEGVSQLAAPTKLAPSAVLAHVGGVPITFASVRQQMMLKSPQTPLPDPPDYSACIARTKGAQAGVGRSQAQLKEACKQSYEQIFQAALSNAIHNQWLIGEAAEEGVHVSSREVQEELEQSKKEFRTEAEFTTYRKSSGQTIADMLFEAKVGKLADGIFKNIKSKERPVTDATVAAYYSSHRSQFTIPEGRALQILRMTSEAAALRARQQLRAGKSFQSIVAELPGIGQPVTSEHGEIKDLVPGVFGQKVLNDAIFSAQPNRLYGPVRVATVRRTIAPEADSGFFLFEVLHKVPEHLTPLSQVKAKLHEELLKSEKESTLGDAIAQIKAKWRSRTSCQSGFVVKNCSEYTGSTKDERADRFTL